MIKQKIKFLFLILQCLVLTTVTGCWDSQDINKKAIVTLVMMDFYNDNNVMYIEKYSFNSLIENNIKSDVAVLRGEGSLITDARNFIDLKNDTDTYTGSQKCIVFTNEFSEHFGIEEYISRIKGSVQYRKTIYPIYYSGYIHKVITFINSLHEPLGVKIEKIIMNNQINGKALPLNLAKIIQSTEDKKPYLLFNLNIAQDAPKLSDYVVYNDNKPVYQTDTNDLNGVLLYLTKNANLDMTVEVENTKYIFNLTLKNKKIVPKYENNKVTFSCDFYLQAKLIYLKEARNVTDSEIKIVGKHLENIIKDNLNTVVISAKNKAHCDFLEFYKYFRGNYKKAYDNNDWNTLFLQSDIKNNVHVNIILDQAVSERNFE